MCGASKEEKQAFGNQQKVSGILTNQLQKFAGEDEAILGELTSSLTPIESAGPSQFGLSPAAEAAERTTLAEQTSAAGAQTANAVRGAIASRGGGTSFLPSGSEDAIIGALAQDTAVKEALGQAAITEHGYDVGRQNWEFATGELGKAPGELQSPVTAAGEAANTGAAGESKAAEAITQANQAWMAPVAGLAGAAIKAAIPGAAFIPSGGGGATKTNQSGSTEAGTEFS